jgi:lipoprotein-anchoring transpeptidase ErfK/SrfK
MRVLSLGIAAFFGLAFLAPASSSARDIVHLSGYPAGTIVIKTGERRLYYITDSGSAIRYPVGVGKAGMAWSGTASIDGKYIKPAWKAPASIRKDYSRQSGESYGCGCHDAQRRGRICHPRHQ